MDPVILNREISERSITDFDQARQRAIELGYVLSHFDHKASVTTPTGLWFEADVYILEKGRKLAAIVAREGGYSLHECSFAD